MFKYIYNKLHKIKLAFIPLWGVIGGLFLIACQDQEKISEGYMEKPSLYFPGKPHDIRAFSGYEKVQLTWIMTGDPWVETIRVFWNEHADSLELPVHADNPVYEQVVDNLPEGTYTFDIRTYDAEGRQSTPAIITGASYGPIYIKSIGNRNAFPIVHYGDGLWITWMKKDSIMLRTRISFINVSNPAAPVPFSMEINNDSTWTYIPNVRVKDTLEIVTTWKRKLWYEPLEAAPTKMLIRPVEVSGYWTFDDPADILKATVGARLEKHEAAGGAIVSIDGPAPENKAISVPFVSNTQHSYLKALHGIAANGGGTRVNEYTIVADVRLPDRKNVSLLQSDLANANGSEWRINNAGRIGISSAIGPGWSPDNSVPIGEWHRVVITANSTNWAEYYVDGVKVFPDAPITPLKVDSDFALDPAGVLLFCDGGSNAANDNTIEVAAVAIFNGALTGDQIKLLGNVNTVINDKTND